LVFRLELMLLLAHQVPFADLFNHRTDGEHLHFTGIAEDSESESESESEGQEEEGAWEEEEQEKEKEKEKEQVVEEQEAREQESEYGELMMQTVLGIKF
jgi:SET domain-containing protein 6